MSVNPKTQHDISKKMYLSLEHQYNSDILNAESSLHIYFNNFSVSKENTSNFEEMDKLIDEIAFAQKKLDILQQKFSKYNSIYVPPINYEYRRPSP